MLTENDLTDELLDKIEETITGETDTSRRWTYLLEEMSDEFNQTSTPDVILLLVRTIKRLRDVRDLSTDEETKS